MRDRRAFLKTSLTAAALSASGLPLSGFLRGARAADGPLVIGAPLPISGAFAANGKYASLGAAFAAQEAGKVLGRTVTVTDIDTEGKPAPGNPFDRDQDAENHTRAEIWSYGHRNGQGATLAPDGRLWMTEHGPQGGDEINVPVTGANHGWPVVTYGENYGGGRIGNGLTSREGMAQPLHHWVPSIATSGMAFLTSDRYGAAWKGNLFVGSLKFGYLDRIELKDGRVVAEHKLLEDGRARIRDVKQGPDGLLYVLTDASRDGSLIRLRPQ